MSLPAPAIDTLRFLKSGRPQTDAVALRTCTVLAEHFGAANPALGKALAAAIGTMPADRIAAATMAALSVLPEIRNALTVDELRAIAVDSLLLPNAVKTAMAGMSPAKRSGDLVSHLPALRSLLSDPAGSGQAARHYADGVIQDLTSVDPDLAEAIAIALPTVQPECIAGAMMAVLAAVPSVRKALTPDEAAQSKDWSRALPNAARIALVAYEISAASASTGLHTLSNVRMCVADHAALALLCGDVGATPTGYAEYLLAAHVRWPGPVDVSPLLNQIQERFADLADSFAVVCEKVAGSTGSGTTTGGAAAAAGAGAGAAGGGQVAERVREYARPTSALSPRMRLATPRGGWGPAPRPSANSDEAKAWRSKLRF